MNDNKQYILNLYNVQFIVDKYGKLVNKFVYAYNEDDAKELVFKHYSNFEFDKNNVYCQMVDIKHGMMFNN